ncbi:MAG: hypothetical protein JWM76_855 [Pseudonocardiales bacterium]|nr:hypothetical protein [Pseudonocardiales bacterium]
MTLWYLARAAGISALIALTVATTLGALGSGKTSAFGRRVVVQYMHRAAAALGVLLIIGHVSALVLDSESGISLSAVAIPFTSSYQPFAVALGNIAAYLLVLVAVTGAARGRMTSSPGAVRAWRAIHLSSYGLWAIAVLHGFLAGSDADLLWVRALDVLMIAAVAVALTIRLRTHSTHSQHPLTVRRSSAMAPVLVRGGQR